MKPKACVVALAAMAGALCAASVFAEESATTPTSEDKSAMRVVVDPETGEVRAPTAEELKAQLARESAAAAAAGLARSSARGAAAQRSQVLPAQKSVQRHANGMLSVRLSQDSLSLLKATPAADGKIKIEHADTSSNAVATEE